MADGQHHVVAVRLDDPGGRRRALRRPLASGEWAFIGLHNEICCFHRSSEPPPATSHVRDAAQSDLSVTPHPPHLLQYTRYPPIDSRGGKVVADYASMSADNSTYTNPLYPTLIVTGAPGDIEVNPDHCSEEWQIQSLCSGNYG